MNTTSKIVLIIAVVLGNIYRLSSQNEALKILPNGNIGIGISNPTATLHVNGSMKGQGLVLNDSLTARDANFSNSLTATDADFTSLKTHNGTFEGPVIMKNSLNNAFVGDVGYGNSWAGFSHKNAIGKKSYGFLQNDKGTYSLMNIKSGDGYMGFRVDNIDRMVIKSNGNVGIGTSTPTAKLQVEGTIKATKIQANTVNGEKPPMSFEVGNKSITNKWRAVNKDVKSLCGDADGCTMKIFFQVVSNRDEVRTISEQIYIEQPGKSNNKNPGLHGWTRQMGGGDKSFVLGTSARYDIIPHPWDWIYVRNYGSPEVGTKTAAYKGYNLQFMVRPGVNATVIIYDR